MDIKSLRLFSHLAETLHFGRTSEHFHMSPSTLSRHIKHIEAEIGYLLLNRDNRSVQLTPEGELFYRYANESLLQWRDFKRLLNTDGEKLVGEISLYCSVTASYSFLYDILSDFRKLHPEIEMKLHTGDPAPALVRVLEGHEDIAIGVRPNTLPTNMRFKRIAISPMVFIIPNTPLHGLPLDLTRVQTHDIDWGQIPMILSEEGIARTRVDQWFRQKRITPKIYAQVAGNEAIVSMVSLGFGVGVVPKIVLDNSPLIDKVRILDVQPELDAFDVGLFTLKKSLATPIINAFWQQVSH
ncbi:HTH-type transcriptional activator IlvY [Marinomonas agarivorans]|nr:HTH-type transcriptional activator IlvY [Marinomonas agarivorans]